MGLDVVEAALTEEGRGVTEEVAGAAGTANSLGALGAHESCRAVGAVTAPESRPRSRPRSTASPVPSRASRRAVADEAAKTERVGEGRGGEGESEDAIRLRR